MMYQIVPGNVKNTVKTKYVERKILLRIIDHKFPVTKFIANKLRVSSSCVEL